MQVPIQISFQNLEPSKAVETAIQRKTKQLEKFYPRITSLHTVVSLSTQRHKHGNLYHIRIHIVLPGQEIVVGRDPDISHAHEDPYVAIRDAFHVARRQIQDYVRIHFRGKKRHRAADAQLGLYSAAEMNPA